MKAIRSGLLLLWAALSTGLLHGETPAADGTSGLLRGMLDEIAASRGITTTTWTENCRLRVIFVQIDRNTSGPPVLTYHRLGMEGNDYFNPASLVKLPLSFLTLERINALKRTSAPWLERTTREAVFPAEPCQAELSSDYMSKEGHPSLAQHIRRALTVSDNPSYNRLFDFLGQRYIRTQLTEKGYPDTYIRKRFSDCSFDQNRYTPFIRFYDNKSNRILNVPASLNTDTSWLCTPGRKAGLGYLQNRQVVHEPQDFSRSNDVPLQDELDMLIRFVLPESYNKEQRWDLTADDRTFLYQYLSTYPEDAELAEYKDTVQFPKFLKKYFLRNAATDLKEKDSLRIVNIVGLAYGFISDVSYVADLENGTEFFLAATMMANRNGIIGDGKYDYEELAFPLYGDLFSKLYRLESNRKKEVTGDFRELREALSTPMK